MASSGAAIITDNILLAKSRCNWLFETMNSNPRLVTVGGTITSQIHDVRTTIAKAIFIANIILHLFPPIANALITFMRARETILFFILTKCFLEYFLCIRTRGSSKIRHAQFVLRRRINRIRVIHVPF